MIVEIRLPQFGMSMQEGTVTEWYKHEGDTVEEGEAVLEVDTSKTTEDVLSPGAGTIARILVPEGETVPVNAVLALLGPTASGNGQSAGAAVGPRPTAAPAHVGKRREVTPRARRLASELGVDLEVVVGTGRRGRVVEGDVRAAVDNSAVAAPAALPLRGMRRTIAERMHASLQSTAQFTLVTTADITELVAARDLLADPRPTYTDFVVRAAALALRRHPRLSSTLGDAGIAMSSDIHVGVAVALDEGLVVPVVRHADRKSLVEIAADSAELVGRARSGAITAAELTGGTFTVSSLGGLGIDAFTPIINPPEAAILGVGRIVDQPTRGPNDTVVWRKTITLSLTVDHRLVDGTPGAEFLQTLTALLAQPGQLT